MKTAATGRGPGAAEVIGDKDKIHRLNTLPPLRLQAQPQVIDLLVEGFYTRPMRPAERSLVVACWWAMRRQGVELPAEKGIILLDGGRP